jgi:hypothetical protein
MTIPFPTPNPVPTSGAPARRPEPLEGPIPFPRRRGAPLGNQNARKHSPEALYNEAFPDFDAAFEAARAVRGCAEEIALLRIVIKAMFTRNRPTDEFFSALDLLNRLIRTHHWITDGEVP